VVTVDAGVTVVAAGVMDPAVAADLGVPETAGRTPSQERGSANPSGTFPNWCPSRGTSTRNIPILPTVPW